MRAARFLARHRLHLTFCALAAVWAWEPLTATRCGPLGYAVVGLVSLAVYQLNRATDLEEDARNCPDEYEDARRSRRAIFAASAAFGAGALVLCAALESREATLLIASLLALGVLYSVPFRLSGGTLRLKSWFPLKTISVAAGWTGLTVLYPVARNGAKQAAPLAVACLLMFAGAAGIQLICDMRDVRGDRQAGIMTLPVRIGIPRTVRWLRLLNAAAAIVIVAVWAAKIIPAGGLVLLATTAMYALALRHTAPAFWERRSTASAVIAGQGTLLLIQGAAMHAYGLASPIP